MKPEPITAVFTLRINWPFLLASFQKIRWLSDTLYHRKSSLLHCGSRVESMVIKIRLSYGLTMRKTAAANRQAVLVMSSLMTPLAVMAWALAFWRIAADLRWAGEFAIPNGIFSHWQVWIAVAIAVQFA